VAVKSNPALVGLSSGFILGHFLLPTVIGGVVNVVKSGETVWVVAVVSAFMLSSPSLRGRTSVLTQRYISIYILFFVLFNVFIILP